MDFGVPIAGGASIVVLSIVLTAFFRLQRTQTQNAREVARQAEITDYRLECAELERNWCQRNFGILAQSVVLSGGKVDPALYDPAPKPQRPDPRNVVEKP